MDQLIHFRASTDFLRSVRAVAHRRGVSVSRLIREAVQQDMAKRGVSAPQAASETQGRPG